MLAGRYDFLRRDIVDGLADRLAMITRPLDRVLELGSSDRLLVERIDNRVGSLIRADPGWRFACAAMGVQCSADALPFADHSLDGVIVSAGLELIDDLPGALIQIRRALRPDRPMLAAMVGAGSFARLRGAMIAADLAIGNAVHTRTLPLVEVRSAGDLLSRAGFAMPVADSETLSLSYASARDAMHDLRGLCLGNLLAGPVKPLSRAWLDAVELAYLGDAVGDAVGDARSPRVVDEIRIIYLMGWSPGEGQPRPAQRGSATASLAASLRPQSR